MITLIVGFGKTLVERITMYYVERWCCKELEDAVTWIKTPTTPPPEITTTNTKIWAYGGPQ